MSIQQFFNPSLSYFESATNPEPAGIQSLSQIADIIRSDQLAEVCASMRKAYNAAGGGPEGKKAIAAAKRQLPAITIAGTFRYRDNGSFNSSSGLVGVDIDGLDDPKDLRRVRMFFESQPWTALVYRSPSGAGIKAAIRAGAYQTYLSAWLAVTRWLADNHLENDPATKDVSRLAFLAHDPEVYLGGR